MALLEKAKITEDLGISIRALLLAKGGHNTDQALVVPHMPLGPSSSFSLAWPPWESDLSLSQHGPGNHGLHLQACDQLLPGCSEPLPHTGSQSSLIL